MARTTNNTLRNQCQNTISIDCLQWYTESKKWNVTTCIPLMNSKNTIDNTSFFLSMWSTAMLQKNLMKCKNNDKFWRLLKEQNDDNQNLQFEKEQKFIKLTINFQKY